MVASSVVHLLFVRETLSHDQNSFSSHHLAKDSKIPSIHSWGNPDAPEIKGSEKHDARRRSINTEISIIIEIIRSPRVPRCIKATTFVAGMLLYTV